MSDDLVMANRANNVPRVAADEPVPPVLTGETLALVHMRGVVELQRHGDVADAHTSAGAHDPRRWPAPRADHAQQHGARRRGPDGHPGPRADPDAHDARPPVGHLHALLRGLARPATSIVTRSARSPRAIVSRSSSLRDRQRDGRRRRAAHPDADCSAASSRSSGPTTTSTRAASACSRCTRSPGRWSCTTTSTASRYQVLGNKRERMAQYGNSVTPPAMTWLIARLADAGVDISRIVDLFCGAGGSSIGAELAGGRCALGLNHWQRAVETHATNFQHADHDCEDVSSLTHGADQALPAPRPADDPDRRRRSARTTRSRRAPARASRRPRRLFDDGPGSDDEQDKSRATMWDVVAVRRADDHQGPAATRRSSSRTSSTRSSGAPATTAASSTRGCRRSTRSATSTRSSG